MDILINNDITESTIVTNGVEVAIAQEVSQTDIIGIAGVSPDVSNFVQKTGDIMSGELELPSLQFDLTKTGSTAEGQAQWNVDKGLLEVQLSQNFDLEIGQQIISKVVNKTGATLAKGKIVYINGGQGNRPTVTLASNNTEATSSKTFAVLAQDISNNGNGWAIVIGALYNLNTASYTAGQTLYLGTSGDFTATKPVAPAHMVAVAKVVNVHTTQGVIEINIQNGFELEELHNVLINTPTQGNVLGYNSATGLWENNIGLDLNNQVLYSVAELGLWDAVNAGNMYIAGNNGVFAFSDYSANPAYLAMGGISLWDSANAAYGSMYQSDSVTYLTNYGGIGADFSMGGNLFMYDSGGAAYGTIAHSDSELRFWITPLL